MHTLNPFRPHMLMTVTVELVHINMYIELRELHDEFHQNINKTKHTSTDPNFAFQKYLSKQIQPKKKFLFPCVNAQQIVALIT